MASHPASAGAKVGAGARAKPVTPSRIPARSLIEAVSRFGAAVKSKLSNPVVTGQPEDQIRGPMDGLIQDLAAVCRPHADVRVVPETPLPNLKTRPDFAVTCEGALVGFIELKAPGKGADPKKFTGHDKDQWERLESLPNLIYSDGHDFSLWRYAERVGDIVSLSGDLRTAGDKLNGDLALLLLFESFLSWAPCAPRDAKQLAHVSAKLCRLLRNEVAEQVAAKNSTLTRLAKDWRKVLFPAASDDQFADGYAQAVTFGMLLSRARNIPLSDGLIQAGQELGKQGQTFMGTALLALTFNGRASLLTSIKTLERVLDAVDWRCISKGNPEAWLYFYEDFLAEYDTRLRKQTGSYYTPAEVVREMVRLVDELLRTRFALLDGLASSAVTLVDPAVGTGTYLLGVLNRIAGTVEAEQGPGAVAGAIDAAIRRLIGFEVQLGPFAVAQVRVLAELTSLIGDAPSMAPRMFVTDTLANPYVEDEWLPDMLEPMAESRQKANQIKGHERVMVVLGNPPYRERAMGCGGWIERGDEGQEGEKKTVPPLDEWMLPPSWGASAHAKHLRNLYVYFWRWATWKVFDQVGENNGIVCFISVAGFINGPGFQKMRDYLRRTTDEIWVIDCSPEGHQPGVSTRIFEAVQQPVCIVIACRSPRTRQDVPARVRFRALSAGVHRGIKFAELAKIGLDAEGWLDCPTGWRAPFRPALTGAWSTYPALEDLFVYHGSGVMPGRTWVIAPDVESLERRWQALIDADADQKEELFHPHLRGGEPGDKHSRKVVEKGLAGHQARAVSVADDDKPCIPPVRYAFRSFDRQWIIPDARLINQPNPELWEAHSAHQVYLTALIQHLPSGGPAITATGLVPDLHHYKGSFGGRAFPLWLDRAGTMPNVRAALLAWLGSSYGFRVSAEDVMAYIAALASHPGYIQRFREDLVTPGLRIPITTDASLFRKAAEIGRTVLWLHSFGERFTDPTAGRPAQVPRLAPDKAPKIPKAGAISPNQMPDQLIYDEASRRLYVGNGYVDGVPPEVWQYEVSGKQVLVQWFSYRKANRERPLIGERRKPSPLGDLRPEHWLAEYTTDLLQVLNVLGRLVELEPHQAALLTRICAGETLTEESLRRAGALGAAGGRQTKPTKVEPSAVVDASPQEAWKWTSPRTRLTKPPASTRTPTLKRKPKTKPSSK
jgi:hypothetical protein